MRAAAVALIGLWAAPVGAQTTRGPYVPLPKVDQEMMAEQAKHPNEHWVCMAADWVGNIVYCSEGRWEPNPAPDADDWKAEGELGAMRKADREAEEAAQKARDAAPYRAAAEFPSDQEHAPVKMTGLVTLSNATTLFGYGANTVEGQSLVAPSVDFPVTSIDTHHPIVLSKDDVSATLRMEATDLEARAKKLRDAADVMDKTP